MYLTFKYRIKGKKSEKLLSKMAQSVNFVWNFCNATSYKALRNSSRWMSEKELNSLTVGSSKELGLNSQTIQAVVIEYVLRRVKAKKRKLSWRKSKGSRRSLGWVPTTNQNIQLVGDSVVYMKHKFRFWASRPIEGTIKSASFNEDSRGHWYVNLVCELTSLSHQHTEDSVGIDLGLKTAAVLSDGAVIENKGFYRDLEERLGKAQRANKKKQVKNLNKKIANRRKDYLHKETTKVAKRYRQIFVGDVSGKFLQATNGKSSVDASTSRIKNLLMYKAIRLSGSCIEVSEKFSTLTCSDCLNKTGPSGLSGLGVREWVCSFCRAEHHRDVNAAVNILRFGHESLKLTKR